ncbi:hypothetical protein GCM10009779_30860 [Polymorphospora rubra]|uniref:Uncharacterized protein n=1 Tax=Polymorphospora rubra TaxID=338584 RepID=A0A810N7G8_9ACTN|nr:hypothetical protein Prubr_47490 [Polymorphospora rubra]
MHGAGDAVGDAGLGPGDHPAEPVVRVADDLAGRFGHLVDIAAGVADDGLGGRRWAVGYSAENFLGEDVEDGRPAPFTR